MKIKTWDNKYIECDFPAEFSNRNLLALPALIDPHVHFRVPGGEHKEDWTTGAAVAGGVTTVLDMPNNMPGISTFELLKQKKSAVNKLLAQSCQPIRPYFYFGATAENLAEIDKVRNEIIGVKMFVGSSTGDLLVSQISAQEKIFKKCAELNLVLAVHAEDDEIIRANSQQFIVNSLQGEAQRSPVIPTAVEGSLSIKHHSQTRSREAAIKAVTQAAEFAKKYHTKLYVLHASTAEELELIRSAKQAGVTVFAEATPHHLFLNDSAYELLGAKAQMNPPLRTAHDQDALWRAINDGTIDTVGTDHAPHTLAEKALPYPQSPSGVPGIETYLPLLLNEYNQGKITIQKIVELTRLNIEKIFNLPPNNDWVIVDLDLEKIVKNKNLKTKCGWSPFDGWKLKGWPVKIVHSQ